MIARLAVWLYNHLPVDAQFAVGMEFARQYKESRDRVQRKVRPHYRNVTVDPSRPPLPPRRA